MFILSMSPASAFLTQTSFIACGRADDERFIPTDDENSEEDECENEDSDSDNSEDQSSRPISAYFRVASLEL